MLAHLCRNRGVEVDDPETISLLSRRCWGVIGYAMPVVSSILIDENPRLTRSIVENYPFPEKDPWAEKFFTT
jgi:hypothetical protein